MSDEHQNGDGGSGSPLFGPPMLVSAEKLQLAWDKLEQALEEIDDRDRYIGKLEQKLLGLQTDTAEIEIDPTQLGRLVSEVEREPIHWVWPGRLAQGKLTILDGDPGLGKSTLLYDLAARITTGRPMPDDTITEQGGVLILSAEDGIADTIRPRLEAAAADLSRCLVVQLLPETDGPGRVPILPDDLGLLEHAARRVDARLLIIDPLMAHLGSATNSYRDQDVRRVLAALSAFAEQCALAVAVVRHLNKMSSGSALYRGGGSIGIIGAARVGLLVGRDPEDEDRLVLASVKNNLARMPASLAFRVASAPADPTTSRIVWEGPSSRSAEDLLSGSGFKMPSVIDEAVSWLEVQLQEGPRPAAMLFEAAEAAGIKKYALQRARRRVADTERIGGVSGAGSWVWRLRTIGAVASVPQQIPPKVTAKMTPKVTNPKTCHLRGLGGSKNGENTPENGDFTKVTPPSHLSEACHLSKTGEDAPKMTMGPTKVTTPSHLSENGDYEPKRAKNTPEKPPEMPKVTTSGNSHLSSHLRRHLSTYDICEPVEPPREAVTQSSLHKGQWVHTPEGEGRVLQVFAHRVMVQIGDRARAFLPDAVVPSEERQR